jgi:hypothetical protein
MKTHIVIDTLYTEEEGNQEFAGTIQECYEWMEKQNTFGLEVKPMTKHELRMYNPELITKSGII